jgi:alpha-N-acetylglucosamine transferase
MLCGGDGYVPGAEVLGRSLDESGTTVPRVVLATNEVSERACLRLARQGWDIQRVDTIGNPGGKALLFARFAHVFTKLRAWELEDFDRVVFLDSDTLVLQNIDELFDRTSFAAAPDFFLPDRFNSGVMVLDPSRDIFGRMTKTLEESATYDGGDQGFLNTFFRDWYAMPVVHRLPAGFNLPHFIYQFAQARLAVHDVLNREARVVHYMLQKPWQSRTTLTGGAGPWWKVYFDIHPEEAAAWKRSIHALEDRTFDYLSALVLG